MAGSTMGHIPTNDPMQVCDNCEGTWTGPWEEVYNQGWRKHGFKGGELVLCNDCEAEFTERRRKSAAA